MQSVSVKSFLRNIVFPAVLVGVLISSVSAHAVTILTGPVATRATNAPLAVSLRLTTDVDTRVSVSVDDNVSPWARDFYNYTTNHSITLLGFKANRTNRITVTVRDRYRNTYTALPVTLNTLRLPVTFPKITVLDRKPEKMEPGYTLCRIVTAGFGTDYLTILDSAGEVVWYAGNSSGGQSVDVRQLENGNLFYPAPGRFVELNMLGNIVNTWAQPPSLPIDVHEGLPTDHGTILYLNVSAQTMTNVPTSNTNPNAPRVTALVKYNQVVELSATNGAVLNAWSLLDMFDPFRITYLTETSGGGWDAHHANAIIEDPADNSIIVSLRHQHAVIKFSRETGQLKWILGPHENWGPEYQQYLLTPVGTPFEWNYGQHAPMLTPHGTLLVYDNGNDRANPFDPPMADQDSYSRAVEYRIDEERMEVSQVWEYGGAAEERIFTAFVGDANWLRQRQNVLITFGAISYVDGVHPSASSAGALMVRIKEVTHDPVPEVVFDVAVFDYTNASPAYAGNWMYRSLRIPDLYPHLPVAVADLTLTFEDGRPRLEFSADPRRTYLVEASPDLVDWVELGEAALQDAGDFEFVDPYPTSFPTRYYRVVAK